jgi:hypothetical protein
MPSPPLACGLDHETRLGDRPSFVHGVAADADEQPHGWLAHELRMSTRQFASHAIAQADAVSCRLRRQLRMKDKQ